MLIDLLSNANNVTFNSVVASVFGLHTAVYLSELMTINEKAIRKGKIKEIDGLQYFTVERKYIEGRITLTTKEQKEIDEILAQLNVVTINTESKNMLYLNIDRLAVLLNAEVKEQVITEISKLSQKKSVMQKKQDKNDYFIQVAKSYIKSNDVYLRPELEKWVESYVIRYNKQLSRQTVEVNENMLLEFAKGNTMIAAEVAKLNYEGYNTMEYAIEQYKKTHANSNTVNTPPSHRVITGELI